jgi:hypothetical protein
MAGVMDRYAVFVRRPNGSRQGLTFASYEEAIRCAERQAGQRLAWTMGEWVPLGDGWNIMVTERSGWPA